MPIRGILLFAVFVASLPVCFVRPFYGLCLYSVVSFLNPQATILYWGAAASFPWAVAAAVPTISGFAMFSGGWIQRLMSRETALICILWGWFTITSVVSTHTAQFAHHSEDTWLRWQLVSKVFLMTLITIAMVNTLQRIRLLVIVMGGCFALIVLKWLPVIAMTGGSIHIYGPPFSMIADNNDLGLALNMTLPMFFFLAQTEEKKSFRRVFALLFAATIPAIFCTYSRGALVGLATVFGLMFLRLKRNQKMLLIPVVVMALAAAVLFAPDAWKERMNPRQGLDGSARERINAWTFSWNLVNDYPLFGGGFSTFTPELFARYAPVVQDVRGSHSVYFGVVAEHGFPGLALYLTLVISCLSKAAKLVAAARAQDDHVVLNYANMFQFSIVGFLISGCFLGRAYFDYFFSIVACLVALDRVARERWSRAESVEEAEDAKADNEPEYLPIGGEWAQER